MSENQSENCEYGDSCIQEYFCLGSIQDIGDGTGFSMGLLGG